MTFQPVTKKIKYFAVSFTDSNTTATAVRLNAK